VVLFHADLHAYELGFDPIFTDVINAALQPIRMPLFFAISGILAARSFARSWPVLLGRSVWPYVYMFALWGLIRWVFFGHVIENPLLPDEGDDCMQLLGMWVMPSTALWYLWALATFYVVGKALDRFRMVALAGAFVLACLTWGGVIPPTVTTYRISVYLFYFLCGAYCGPFLLATLPSRPWTLGLAALAGFLLLEYAILPGLPHGLAAGVLIALESVLGLVVGGNAAVLLARLAWPRTVLGYVGRHTLPVYVTHTLLIAVFCALLVDFTGMELWRWITVPLVVLASTATALLFEAVSARIGLGWLYRAPRLPTAPKPVTP
jgi:uncharacterized membrane protein YcfT